MLSMLADHLPLQRIAAVVLAGAMSACASTPAADRSPDPIATALQQPFRDLSLVRENAAEVLKRADAAPYEAEGADACDVIVAEISALDAVLGPDLDRPRSTRGGNLGGLAEDAVGDLVGLPFRGLIRRLTGAEKRDRELRHAVLAGMVRRGFLKGLALANGCNRLAVVDR